MPLKLRLKPQEKIVINGAVISASENGSTLILHNKVTLLREKDIIREEDANTPTKRLYFQIMCMYIDSDKKEEYFETYMDFLSDLIKATHLKEMKRSLMFIYNDVASGELYRALKTCRAMIAVENELLNNNNLENNLEVTNSDNEDSNQSASA